MDGSAIADLIPWADVGLTGLVSIGVVMILTGRLVPRSTVQEMRHERDARLSDLRAAYDASEEARRIQGEQLGELLETSRTNAELLEGLRQGHDPGGRQ
ncbi:hypothetical protein [Streptomonospora litoralis]|uniref:Uncharacterized protein n=1 Tax=Streptomonospora litoralis TaxID=2498135 RepID=A0A4P6Q7R8_9ACTN|nr:hypothetical protein [Streptomonospora litoralis]QBI56763.1 hypothetical protein EKD16_25110 [Streptomonospora litoralis]